jgi:hypothetical protein
VCCSPLRASAHVSGHLPAGKQLLEPSKAVPPSWFLPKVTAHRRLTLYEEVCYCCLSKYFDLPTGCATSCKQAGDEVREGSCWKQTEGLCPPDRLRGERTRAWKKLCCEPVPPVLAESKKSRNASDSDTHLRWSPPSIACESVLPTPAMMRTHGTRRAGRRGNTLRNVGQCKHLDVLPTPVGDPAATK